MTSVPIGMDASVKFAETSVGSRKFGREERKPSTRIEHPGDLRGDRSTKIEHSGDLRGDFRRKSNVSETFAATFDENQMSWQPSRRLSTRIGAIRRSSDIT
ncbi:hypothetical protein [Tannerella sp.]|uniref:hypothetical protein n=1 Tax=Tannerella sp. TaxID=2382127 RepID=UPI003FA1F5E2